MSTAAQPPADENEQLLALLANLQVCDRERSPPPSPPPRTPSPPPPPAYQTLHHTFPGAGARVRFYPTPPPTTRQYYYESPTRRGTTSEWSIAGAATQGIPSAQVRAITPKKKKSRTKKAAYVVFCGKRCGVFLTWDETRPLVSGVPNCIFRGYISVADAHHAYTYAQSRSWTRVADAQAPVLVLPPSLLPRAGSSASNPLNGSENLDGLWYIVYRGICPGVYRSHLESQLNTLGVRRSLHESVDTEVLAHRKYAKALEIGAVEAVPPTYHPAQVVDSSDPFA